MTLASPRFLQEFIDDPPQDGEAPRRVTATTFCVPADVADALEEIAGSVGL